MTWSTSLKGLNAPRLARLLGDVDRPPVAFSLAAIDAWRRSVGQGAREVGTWAGEVPPGLWGGAPVPELVGLDVGATRVFEGDAAPDLITFHTSIADAAHRSPPPTKGD